MADYTMPVEISLQLLEALHARWVVLLRSLSDTELQRTFIHPDSGVITVWQSIGVYAWHGRHHVAHLKMVR
ncbi:DinB family protein [Brevibacillus invocatus]|uniref:DinB family protein n=1 Tax=Brevibacillus invocatus TaxID=173959 RepID=UPI0039F0EA77